jgi:hypothetical protein
MNAGDAKDTDRLEKALQASLRPVDPGADFTATLQARLAAVALHPLVYSTPVRHSRWGQALYSASLALAATIVVALAVGWQWQDLRVQRQAEQARLQQARVHTQLLLALEITSERLGQAAQRIEQYQSRENQL